MDTRPLSRRAFDTVTPDSDEAKALTAALESGILQAVMAAAETAARDVVARLNAAGHSLSPDEPEGPLAFRGPAGSGDGVLKLDVNFFGTVSAELSPASRAVAEVSAPGGEEEASFYKRLDAARQKERRVGYRALSAKEQLVLCVGDFEAEINNGGFSQFFWNSAGDRAAATLRFLKRIGAAATAELLEEAMALFPEGKPPANRAKREQVLPDVERRYRKRFERLDARFYESGENLVALAARALGSVRRARSR